MGGQEHFYLEGQAALALPQEGGDMVVHSSTQHPTEIQHKVAEALGVPMHAVRCEVRRMGGGFGGKESQGNALAVACAVAARLTGQPCKMRYDRDDDMMITGKRHDFRITYDAGFDGEGRLTGVDFTQYDPLRLGAGSVAAGGGPRDAARRQRLSPARRADHIAPVQDQHPIRHGVSRVRRPAGRAGDRAGDGPYRGRTGPDPVEVRQRNYYAGDGRQHQGPPGTGAERALAVNIHQGPPYKTTPYHMPVKDFILHEMTEALLTIIELSRAAGCRSQNGTPGKSILKKGIAFSPVKFGISFTLTHLNQAGALVHVYQDGSVHMNHGGTEMGQGLFQKVAQVAAHRFGIDVDAVKITATDTGKVPNTSATAASSGTDLNGMAVANACDTIRDRIAACLADCTRRRQRMCGLKTARSMSVTRR